MNGEPPHNSLKNFDHHFLCDLFTFAFDRVVVKYFEMFLYLILVDVVSVAETYVVLLRNVV
jgi:hypothetical protein